MVPAGVIIIGSILLECSAAKMTVMYPAKFAWELKASIFWAIVERGIISIEIELIPFEANSSIKRTVIMRPSPFKFSTTRHKSTRTTPIRQMCAGFLPKI